MKRFVTMIAFAIALTFGVAEMQAPAFAQYNPHGSVGTGGSMAHQHRVPHAHQHYINSCRGYGRNNPWCLNQGQQRYGQRPVQRPQYHYGQPRRHAAPQYRYGQPRHYGQPRRHAAPQYNYGHRQYRSHRTTRSAPVHQGPRQSTARGAAHIPMGDLQVSNTPCRLSSGMMGVIVKVRSTGEMRCGRG